MFWKFDPPTPGEIISRNTVRPHDIFQNPTSYDLTATDSSQRPYIDDPVGIPDHILVVFDDNHRITRIAQGLQTADQLNVVALMQPDAGLIQDIEYVDQFRTDLRSQPDPLTLTARQ